LVLGVVVLFGAGRIDRHARLPITGRSAVAGMPRMPIDLDPQAKALTPAIRNDSE
jgi:hypothetical protein